MDREEYRIVRLNNDSVGYDFRRFQQGFAAKIVTPDFDGKDYTVCYFEDEDAAEEVCSVLNEAVAECFEAPAQGRGRKVLGRVLV